LWSIAHWMEPRIKLKVADDPDDNAILECALAAQAPLIVTGDKDLLRLSPFRGIRILTPAQFLAEGF
jgi:putative PIN family toxin of toxin-antitoxin system